MLRPRRLPILLPALLLTLLLVVSAAFAQTREVVAPLARVIFDDPALEPYARRVAAEAEATLRTVHALFGSEPRPIVITLDTATDAFNAYASSVPRDAVALRAVFPVDVAIGLDAADPLRLLLLHEITHLVQLGYPDFPADPELALPDLGVLGQGTLAAVPSWFLEGIATWVESELTAGGRRDDATTRGLLRALALEADAWPSLADAGLISYGSWPGGDTRYLLGAGFLGWLIDRYGFAAIPAALREVRGGWPWRDFSGAWYAATGTDLAVEWNAWRGSLRAAAERAAAVATPVALLDGGGGRSAHPTLAPDGERLAWRAADGSLRVATLRRDDDGARLERDRTLTPRLAPSSVAWLDDATLIATALQRRPGSLLSELVVIDAASGRSETLTRGAHAHAARPDPWLPGCVLFVRDRVPDGSDLLRTCSTGSAGESAGGGAGALAAGLSTAPGWTPAEVVWVPPEGMRSVGLATHPERGVALALWRGGAVRLALLPAPGAPLKWLSGAAGDVRDPVFTAAGALRFASDASGIWELIELDPAAPEHARRLTRSVGGADQPSAGAVYRSLTGSGYQLALLPADPAADAAVVVSGGGPPPAAPPAAAGSDYPLRRYDPRPSLVPYGWLLTEGALTLDDEGLGGVVELSIYGQDDAGRIGTRLAGGIDSGLDGPLGGAWLYLDLDGDPRTSLRSAPMLIWNARLGVWPHTPHRAPRTETAQGGRLGARLQLPYEGATLTATARIGALHLVSTAALAFDGTASLGASTRSLDRWGVPQRGATVQLRAALSPTSAGPSAGVWLEASGVLPLPPLGPVATSAIVSLRAGWRPPPPLPLRLADLAAVVAVGSRHTLPLPLRYGDGLAALERLAIEPTVRLWIEAGGAPGIAVGVGADLGLAADLVIGYNAPLRLGVRGGWARGVWWRWELGVPF